MAPCAARGVHGIAPTPHQPAVGPTHIKLRERLQGILAAGFAVVLLPLAAAHADPPAQGQSAGAGAAGSGPSQILEPGGRLEAEVEVEEQAADDAGGNAAARFEEGYPVVPEEKELLRQPATGQVYQLDLEPLADRDPLLLVHGGGGEHQRLFRWEKVVDRLQSDPEFERRYKIYLYRYDTKAHLNETVPVFQRSLLQLQKDSGGKTVSVLALSMGGNLIQGALVDPVVDAAVDLVFCMGTPFHGSPLFSADWFQYSLDKTVLLPWARVVHSLDYRLYFSRHRNYLEDLKWDNTDRLIPNVGRFKPKVPVGPKGILTVERDANERLARINAPGGLNKRKFVTYAGYLLNPYLASGRLHKLEQTFLAPYRFFAVRVASHLGREHAALKLLNQEMVSLKVNDVDPVGRVDRHVYSLNDGICPVTSALFLPHDVLRDYPLLREEDLVNLRYATDVGLARVFRNVDHVTFVEGQPPHRGKNLLRDELHPEHGERSILDWILEDLKTMDKVPPAAARSKPAESASAR